MSAYLEPPADALRTGNATFWIEDDGIVRVVYDEGSPQTLEFAKEGLKVLHGLTGSRETLVLGDITGTVRLTREAREYGASPEAAAQMTAVALLVGSNVARLIGNFFIKVTRPPFPTKMFTSVESATGWLYSHRSE